MVKLYNLLGINNRIFEYSTKQQILAYSHLNKEFDNIVTPYFSYGENSTIIIQRQISPYNYNNFKYVESNDPPSILIIIIRDYDKDEFFNYNQYLIKNIINDSILKKTLTSMEENITYMNVKYNLDSVLLNNWNTNSTGSHAIAGITCKKKHYVYNGWARSTMDPTMGTRKLHEFPCELMQYDWNIKENGDFCLNTEKCIPEILKRNLNNHDLCFNFSKGERILIYVRKDTNKDPSSQSSSSHKNSHNDEKLSSPPLRRSSRSSSTHNDNISPLTSIYEDFLSKKNKHKVTFAS
jgi:hypothetical protein